MKIEHTERGFEIIKFVDLYMEKCSLQQSSLADNELPGSSAVWFGTDSGKRMHLGPADVKELVTHLQQWLETGSFE